MKTRNSSRRLEVRLAFVPTAWNSTGLMPAKGEFLYNEAKDIFRKRGVRPYTTPIVDEIPM